MEEFIVDTISRTEFEKYGFDSSNVSDETMKKIAGSATLHFPQACTPKNCRNSRKLRLKSYFL